MSSKFKKILATLLVAVGLVAVSAAPAQAYVYWNCSNGVACVWVNSGGGGSKATLAVGQYGYGQCHNFNSTWNDKISSASADFGGGWDLQLYYDANCHGELASIYTTMSISFTGIRAWQNDEASSFAIIQAGPF